MKFQLTPIAICIALYGSPAFADDAKATFTLCAAEGSTCVFSGTQTVRFGTSSNYISAEFTGSVACNISSFGFDPALNEAKSCYTSGSPAPAPVPTGSIPTPASVAARNLPVTTGQRTLQSGETLQNVRITNPDGDCVVIAANATNVTVQDSEIGPCGQNINSGNITGIKINQGASNITIQRNVIHDAGRLIQPSRTKTPLTITRNYLYNIVGPVLDGSGAGQAIQLDNSTNGPTGRVMITCNRWNGREPIPPVPRRNGIASPQIGDPFALFQSLGTAAQPIEFAYNLGRGAASNAYNGGSFIQILDGFDGRAADPPMGYAYVHHNWVVQTPGAINLSGGTGSIVEYNKVDNRGENAATNTSWSFTAKNFSSNIACTNNIIRNNSNTAAIGWAYDGGAVLGQSLLNYGTCGVTASNNVNAEPTLQARTPQQNYDAFVAEQNAACP